MDNYLYPKCYIQINNGIMNRYAVGDMNYKTDLKINILLISNFWFLHWLELYLAIN